MKRLAIILAAIMIAACNPTTKGSAVANKGDGNSGGTGTTTSTTDVKPTPDKPEPAQAQSVYFEFAKANIASEYNGTIDGEATSVKARRGETIRLEGNTDERGSAEYNLGLGQRRADAVKRRMVAAGVPARQIKAVSLGKEKPKASCHDESCWKENRRVDFVQQG